MEKEPFFDEICSKLNIDSIVKKSAYSQYSKVSKNTILTGDIKHWICCALFTAGTKTKIPIVSLGDAYMQGNGVSLVKLIKECNMNIYTFFDKIEIWLKVSSVPNDISHKVDTLKRNFQLSQLIYKEFSNCFCKLFNCNEPLEDIKIKMKRKSVGTPYTCQKLFEICWTLFTTIKGYPPMDKPNDLVSCIHLLLCCLDIIFKNVLNDNRRDLINSSFPGLPKNFFSPSYDASKEPPINIIENLSDDSFLKTKSTHWEMTIHHFLTEKKFLGTISSILSVENFEANLKKLNNLYEAFILSYGQFDERIFLSHPEIGSKFYGKAASQSSAQVIGSSMLIPQTPLSGQDLSYHASNKLSPISSCKQIVQKLEALCANNQTCPPNSLTTLLCSHSDTILKDLEARLQKTKEIFCNKMGNSQERFRIVEFLYYRLLENIIYSEIKTHGRYDFINDDDFNQALIVLCLEIVLFAFSLHKELTTLLEIFNLESFHFYKLIEVAIRNNKDYFTNDIIKHLKAIEEQCLDSLAWSSGSLLWEKIKEFNNKLPTSQEVDASLQNANSPSNQAPKSVRLFLRKFYQLAHLRLKDLCKNLQFSNNTELLRKIWTLFEYAILEHTTLMKDRNLDQILMCCVYVLCKIRVRPILLLERNIARKIAVRLLYDRRIAILSAITALCRCAARPTENRHTFADIMKFYRSQPQADSNIYRSVFIEYVQEDKSYEENQLVKSNATEPEVISGRNTIYGKESRGDIIFFYNKVFVPKMQQFAMRFSTSSQNNLLLSPLPPSRPLISPRKISPYHDVYVQPLNKQSILSPSARTLTFTFDQSPSKELQKINSMINQNRKAAVAKRFNMDCEFPPSKVSKESSLHVLISDRQELSN